MTINDIARLAGVSKATVSNVMNNTGRVGEDTRTRVMQIVSENEFSMNMSARILAGNHSKIIGAFATDLDYLSHSVFFSELLSSIIYEMKEKNYSLMLGVTGKDRFFDTSLKLDGAILINPRNESEYTERLVQSKLPLVIVGRPCECEQKLHYVDTENVSIGYLLTRKLIENGHRRIVFFGGPEEYTVTIDQLCGYRRALEESGIAFDESLILYSGYILAEKLPALQRILEIKHPTAVAACSDNLAVTAAKTAEKSGILVPRDLSIVCFAGTYMTRFYNPPITSSHTDTKALGRKAFYKLLKIIDKKLLRSTASFVDYSIFEGKSVRKLN